MNHDADLGGAKAFTESFVGINPVRELDAAMSRNSRFFVRVGSNGKYDVRGSKEGETGWTILPTPLAFVLIGVESKTPDGGLVNIYSAIAEQLNTSESWVRGFETGFYGGSTSDNQTKSIEGFNEADCLGGIEAGKAYYDQKFTGRLGMRQK